MFVWALPSEVQGPGPGVLCLAGTVHVHESTMVPLVPGHLQLGTGWSKLSSPSPLL